jgi:hypothetical protein
MRTTTRPDHHRLNPGMPASRSMNRHCDRLIILLRETAREYEELAKLHEAEAAAN